MESNIIFHIDVNSAFLSWTAVKMLKEGSQVDIREIPAIIGGDREKRHGVVLANTSVDILAYHLKSSGRTLWCFANGIDINRVSTVNEKAKGIGNSVTLSRDYDNIEEIDKILLQLSEKVAGRLRSKNCGLANQLDC